MNKNTIIGSLLIAVIMIWWMSTMPKQPVPQKVDGASTTVVEEVEKDPKRSLEIPTLKNRAESTEIGRAHV